MNDANIQSVGLSYIFLAFSDVEDDLILDKLSANNNDIDSLWTFRLNFKICQALKVKELDLSSNNFKDRGAKQLTQYFMKN